MTKVTHNVLTVEDSTNIYINVKTLSEDDHFYPEPDWESFCDFEVLGYDNQERYYEGRCGFEAEYECCGQQLCERHYEGHLEGCEKPVCVWCEGTGMYSGPMLLRYYAGPCLMCNP